MATPHTIRIWLNLPLLALGVLSLYGLTTTFGLPSGETRLGLRVAYGMGLLLSSLALAWLLTESIRADTRNRPPSGP